MPHRLTLHARRRNRGATTLAEMMVVLALVALLTGLVLPPFKRSFDRLETRAAAQDAMTAFFAARAGAISLGRRTAVVIDQNDDRMLVISGGDTLMTRRVGAEHGVRMRATRDSMTFFPDGLGLGGANLSIVFIRGAAADTVLVSREGRVKLGTRAR